MQPDETLDKTDVVILCGGFGTRLRSVLGDRPKPMALIHEKPFLEILVNHVAGFGFRRFIFCVHHMAENIQKHFEKFDGLETIFSKEETPLGTAGALRLCEPLIKSSTVLILNGDSFCSVDLNQLLVFHTESQRAASLVLTKDPTRRDGGFIRFGENGRILAFHEKKNVTDAPYINAGIYAFTREVIHSIPEGRPCSLENEIFPSLIPEGLYGYVTEQSLDDIGTPERLENFKLGFQS